MCVELIDKRDMLKTFDEVVQDSKSKYIDLNIMRKALENIKAVEIVEEDDD